MAEGDDVVAVYVGHRADSAHLHIAVDQRRGYGAARFQGRRRFVGRRRGRIDGHEVVLRQLGRHPFGRHAVEAAHHKRRRDGNQRRFPGVERTDFFLRRHVPQLEHIADRRNHADAGIRKGPAVGDGPDELAVDIHGAAAHALGDAARFLYERPGKLRQYQIAGRAAVFHDSQYFYGKCFYRIAVNYRLGVSRHALAHFADVHEVLGKGSEGHSAADGSQTCPRGETPQHA